MRQIVIDVEADETHCVDGEKSCAHWVHDLSGDQSYCYAFADEIGKGQRLEHDGPTDLRCLQCLARDVTGRLPDAPPAE